MTKKSIILLCFWIQLIILLCLWIPLVGYGETSTNAVRLFEPGTLRERLPDNAVAYLRIPNPWQLFVASEGSILQPALSQEAYLKPLKTVQTAIHEQLLKHSKTPFGPSLALFLKHLNSPVEALFLNPLNTPTPVPNAFISAKLDFESIAEFNAFLKALAQQVPEIKIIKELSAEGHGQVQTTFPMFLHYDEARRLLNVMSGVTVTEVLFTQTLEQLANTATQIKTHPMYALEAQVDTSHQGLFFWVNGQAIMPWVGVFLAPEIAAVLQGWGVFDIRAIALGWGIRDGKGRVSVLVDSPKTGAYREALPTVANQLTLDAAGQPHTVLLISLPAADLFTAFDRFARPSVSPDDLAAYDEFLATFKQTTGSSLVDALRTIGPELMVFGDEAGEFMAVRLNDADRWRILVATLSQRYRWRYIQHDHEGMIYHELIIPGHEHDTLSGSDSVPESTTPPPTQPLDDLERLGALFNAIHVFWIEADGHLIFSQVPQTLKERQQFVQRTSLDSWLSQMQQQDPRSALALLSTTLNAVPRRTYYGYIQLLNHIADVLKVDIDLMALPTATELNLPKTGSYGLQLDLTDKLAKFEIVFDQTPLDFAYSPMGLMAVVGLGAAIALPAFSQSPEDAD